MNNLKAYQRADLQDLFQNAAMFCDNALSQSTKKAYDLGWRMYNLWCTQQHIDPMKETNIEALVAFFLSDKAAKGDLKYSSLFVYLCGIKHFYEKCDIRIDIHGEILSRVMMGIRRKIGVRPDRKEPIVIEGLRAMTADLDYSRAMFVRNRALFVLGFAGAFRISELRDLNIEDIAETEHGFMVLVKKSKTDQEQSGMLKAIPYGSNINTCPVRSIKAWVALLHRTTGPVFVEVKKGDRITQNRLWTRSIACIIKKNDAILDKPRFAGHSLRSGFVTTAAKNNVPLHRIMAATGHRSVTSLMVYIREALEIKDGAATRVGL